MDHIYPRERCGGVELFRAAVEASSESRDLDLDREGWLILSKWAPEGSPEEELQGGKKSRRLRSRKQSKEAVNFKN